MTGLWRSYLARCRELGETAFGFRPKARFPGLKAYNDRLVRTGAAEPTTRLLEVYASYKRTQEKHASLRSSEGQPTDEGRRAHPEIHAQSIKGEDHGK